MILLRVKKGFLGMLLYAAVLFALLLALCLLLRGSAAPETAKLPIVLYHDVSPDGTGEYCVSTAQLESDLAALRENGWQTVTLSEVIAFVHEGKALPEHPVLLVFDDGYRSVLSEVLPLLEKYDAHALVSVIGAYASGKRESGDGAAYMDWAALRRAVESGHIELQSHSAYLHVYGCRRGVGRLPGEDEASYAGLLAGDNLTMQSWAKEAGVTLQPSFAYPYGVTDPLADRVFQRLGCLATMNSEPYVNVLSHDAACLFELGRFHRSGLISTQELIDWLNAC